MLWDIGWDSQYTLQNQFALIIIYDYLVGLVWVSSTFIEKRQGWKIVVDTKQLWRQRAVSLRKIGFPVLRVAHFSKIHLKLSFLICIMV